jgi:hypothetical protein
LADKNNTPAISGPLGGLPGSGRTPKALMFKNYPQAIKMLDEGLLDAIQVLKDGLKATTNVYSKDGTLVEENVPDKWFRYNCAIQLLKKAIPDKKIKEITGPEGGPVEVNINKREAVLSILQIIEDKPLEELRREIEDGSFQLSQSDRRREIEAEEEMEGEAKEERTRIRSGRRNSE